MHLLWRFLSLSFLLILVVSCGKPQRGEEFEIVHHGDFIMVYEPSIWELTKNEFGDMETLILKNDESCRFIGYNMGLPQDLNVHMQDKQNNYAVIRVFEYSQPNGIRFGNIYSFPLDNSYKVFLSLKDVKANDLEVCLEEAELVVNLSTQIFHQSN